MQVTIPTRATSTDGWTTLENQTVTNGGAERLELNDWIRTLPEGLDGYFELADLIESSRDSGKWRTFETENYITDDGTHPNDNGHMWIRDQGLITIEESLDGGTGILTDAAGPFAGPFSNGGDGVLTEVA
jgi:hypothetical protein